MNTLCINCDAKNRLGMCIGKDGDFKYCYRRVGSVGISQQTITQFNTLDELVNTNPSEFDYIKTDTLVMKDYSKGTKLLSGEYSDGKIYPVGFIISE